MGIEKAIRQLVTEFTENPYHFFTEADAVTRFGQLLEEHLSENLTATSFDSYEISLVHREFPTYFRFSKANPTARLSKPAKRGHYDTVILNPDFIMAHRAETIHNRSIKNTYNAEITPFLAVVEFKLDNLGWSSGSTWDTIADLGKLRLSNEAPLRYFIHLMRYSAPNLRRWERCWPVVETAAIEHASAVRSIFAVSWLSVKNGHEIYQFGGWGSQITSSSTRQK